MSVSEEQNESSGKRLNFYKMRWKFQNPKSPKITKYFLVFK